MDLRDAVVWSYRIFLNRDPETDSVIEHYSSNHGDIPAIRSNLVHSAEYLSCLDRAGQVFEPRLPFDAREGARWCYRLLLDREAGDADLEGAVAAASPSLNDLRLHVATRREFDIRMTDWMELLQQFSIFNAFAPFPARVSVPDAYNEFLGSLTPVRFLPGGWSHLAGHVYSGPPRSSEPSPHSPVEWAGTLRSVLEAGEGFTAVELGAGWGPWLAASYKAAKLRGIDRVHLVGVEGSQGHYEFMRENMAVNGVADHEMTLHHAVAGAVDGTASFPKLNFVEEDYGANAVFHDGEKEQAAARGALETVASLSLETLIADLPLVDLMHIDIQGHEEVVVRAGIGAANAKVRRMVIGTHSRAIDGALIDLMQENGWFCEAMKSCDIYRDGSGRIWPGQDGEQIWRNDRL